MNKNYNIRLLQEKDIPTVTLWARNEGFAPGKGDVDIYRNTDSQGLWVGCINSLPISCIAGVKYNSNYGFIGLFIVREDFRGHGYGVKLWQHVINNLSDVTCLGIEAATYLIDDYQSWGFIPSSITTRWQLSRLDNSILRNYDQSKSEQFRVLENAQIPYNIIQDYDKNKENTPRPHFLSDWLLNKSGTVLAVLGENAQCFGFARIRPCLLKEGIGHRIGPLIAETPSIAILLLETLISRYPGVILIDSPGANLEANSLFRSLGFKSISHTVRMYRGEQPSISLEEVYGLACLELG